MALYCVEKTFANHAVHNLTLTATTRQNQIIDTFRENTLFASRHSAKQNRFILALMAVCSAAVSVIQHARVLVMQENEQANKTRSRRVGK